jgi:hypothetical protein
MKDKRQACWTFGANLPGVINRDREGKICLDIKGGGDLKVIPTNFLRKDKPLQELISLGPIGLSPDRT